LAANSVINVDAVNAAAWNNFATLRFNASVRPTSRYIIAPEAQVITIEAMPLDSVLNGLGVAAVDFLKVDVEGAAMETLQGMTNSLQNTRYAAIAAYHGNLARIGLTSKDKLRENAQSIADFLRANGFNVVVHGYYFGLVPYVYARKYLT
jgi:hypothetical protein